MRQRTVSKPSELEVIHSCLGRDKVYRGMLTRKHEFDRYIAREIKRMISILAHFRGHRNMGCAFLLTCVIALVPLFDHGAVTAQG